MKKPLILAALSGMILIGAAYPDSRGPSGESKGIQSGDRGGERYRPCRSRRDDNCIQLYERGVSARYARWLRDGDPGWDESVRYAVHDGRGHHRRGGYARAEMRREHRDHGMAHGDHRRDDMAHRDHRRDEHARHGHHARDRHADHRGAHGRRGHPRLAMADMVRCEHLAAPPPAARAPRAPHGRPHARPQPRSRMHEDSGVRGM